MAVPPHLLRLLAIAPWALPALVLLVSAAFEQPPPPLALAGAGALLVGLGVAGRRLATVLLPDSPAATRTAAGLVFATAGAILPALALGHFGALGPRAFLALEALLIAAVALAARPPVAPEAATVGPPAGREPWWLRALRVAAFAAAGVGALGALHAERHLAPSKLDDPSYHLTTVAVWHHYGDLRTPKFGYGDPSTAYYPIGGELIDWALLAPLRDSDFLLRWAQLPFFLATLLAAAAVARELGLGRSAAATAVFLVLTVPRAFPAVALSAGNDHSTAFFAVAAAAAALRLAARPSGGAAIFAGTALGLLVGSKYLGLLFALPLGALLLLVVAAPDRPLSPRRRMTLLLLAAGVAVLVGGYTYLRNAVVLGNPVFPVPIALAGLSLPGWEEATLAVRRLRPEFAIEPLAFLFDRRLLGPVFPWIAVPAAALAPALALASGGGWRRRIRRAAVLLLPAVFFLEFLFLVHDHRDVRYLFAAIAIAAVAAAAIAGLCRRRWRWVAPAVESAAGVVVLVRFATFEPLPPYAPLLVAAAAGAAVLLAATARRASAVRWRPVGAAAGTLLALAGCTALAHELAHYQREKYGHHPIVAALERLAPEGAVVAYAGFNQPYPLYGARLEHRVEQVPTRGAAWARHYSWDRGAAMPWRTGRYRAWRRNLRELGVGYVVLEAEADPERRWVALHPDDFEPITFFGSAHLWRFTPRRTEDGLPETAP